MRLDDQVEVLGPADASWVTLYDSFFAKQIGVKTSTVGDATVTSRVRVASKTNTKNPWWGRMVAELIAGWFGRTR